MPCRRTRAASRRLLRAIGVLGWLAVPMGLASCDRPSASSAPLEGATLRVGLPGLPQQASQSGVRPLMGNFSLEGLINLTDEGRARPWVAEGWTVAPDGLSLTVRLRPHTKFHDGSVVTAPVVSRALQTALPTMMGPAFDDVVDISAPDDSHVVIHLRQPTPLVLEALEATLQKPGQPGIGTGAFAPAKGSATTLTANADYYLGRPAIEHIVLTSYPSARTAWAELLRGNLDMLYETNIDALDSLQASNDVSVFSFVRHYQYMILFGPRLAAPGSADIRRALNAAIDRDALVRDALNSHGVASTGPVSERNWALTADAPRLKFRRELAQTLFTRKLKFTCLVPPDTIYERVALHVKRQLAQVSVDMEVQEASQEQIVKLVRAGNYDAVLGDVLSGASMFRLYERWHTGGGFNPGKSSPAIDAALDRVRHAASDDEYRAGVTAFQQAMIDDPPALFLAWSERARAVSRRFNVPSEKGRDVLGSLRLWRPAAASRLASTN